MTMVNDDSDSDDERTNSVLDPKPSTSKTSPSKLKVSPKEDKPVTIKQEVDVSAEQASSMEPVGPPGGHPGFPGTSRDSASAPAAVPSMQGMSTSMAAAAMLMKNLPSSAASLLLPAADKSVLSSYGSSKEQLLASLIARGKEQSGVSPLLGHLLRDSDEPATKKPRKTELPSTCVKSSKDSASYNSFNKGFSLHPVSSATAASLRLTGSQTSSPPSEPPRTPSVGSALRLASLPGVSLTAVSSRNTPQSPVSSHRLMPPPSSAVTLSPVPRTSVTVTPSEPSPPVLTNPAELRCIETGDKPSVKPSPVVHSVDISPSKQSLTPKVPPLLINPVTGQFEAGGAGESAPESDLEASVRPGARAGTADSALEEREQGNKHKSGAETPANSTSEQPLIIKLKVSSIPNNSSKNLVTQKNDAVKNNIPNKQVEEPKVPKIKIRIGRDQTIVKLNNDDHENHDSNDSNDLTPENLHSPIPNDIKTKVKIKPIGSKSPLHDQEAPSTNGPAFPNSIANHTSDNEVGRKTSKKVMKKDKKDRLTVWTESLAKHGEKREEKKEERSKEAKTWPEVLESRLYGSAGSTGSSTVNNSIPTNSSGSDLPFNKCDVVLENQAGKGAGIAYSRTVYVTRFGANNNCKFNMRI